MTALNRKKEKSLIEKEDPQNMAVLTLLPKIDRLRLTKRRHKMNCQRVCEAANCMSLLQHEIVYAHLPLRISQFRFSVC